MDKNTFNGQRLKTALQYRGKRMSDLARDTGISRQSLSLYAKNENTPPFENILAIANSLHFPVEYFMTEDSSTVMTDNIYFRSQAAATKKSQTAQKVKLETVAKIYEILLNNYIDFPSLNLPKISFSGLGNPVDADSESIKEEIEDIANMVREYWNLGSGPLDDLQYILERNGIIVTGFDIVDETIDAFSQRIRINDSDTVFIIALALGNKSKERLRFDLAHELGHVLLHSWVEALEELSRDEFLILEKQANMFASALLLPKQTFGEMVKPYATNPDFYKPLKKRWGVSMQAMMFRAWQLGLVSVNQFQYMMRIVSKKGWRKHEPGDSPGTLGMTIFQAGIDALFDAGWEARDIHLALGKYGIYLNNDDLEDLMGLKPGILKTEAIIIPLAKVKK